MISFLKDLLNVGVELSLDNLLASRMFHLKSLDRVDYSIVDDTLQFILFVVFSYLFKSGEFLHIEII